MTPPFQRKVCAVNCQYLVLVLGIFPDVPFSLQNPKYTQMTLLIKKRTNTTNDQCNYFNY